MRPAPGNLWALLSDSFDATFEADLYYGFDRIFEGLPIGEPSLRWDGKGQIEASGSVEVQWTDDHGSSLSPHEPQDWLAPFGSRLVIFCRITAGGVTERVQLGVFKTVAVPTANDHIVVLGETRVTVGSRVQMTLNDLMIEVQRDKFTDLAQPTFTDSAYAELVELTGFALTKTLPDSPIERTVTYEQERINAVQDVAGIVGGSAFIEWDGTLSVRPFEPGSVVGALTVGEDGTVLEVRAALDSQDVYNGIIIRGETSDQAPILAERWIEQGPLRATPKGGERTPYHRVPKFWSDPINITTQEQAEAIIDDLLAEFSQPRAAQLEVDCVLNPLYQVGDVVTVNDGTAVWTIRIVRIDIPGARMWVLGDVLSRVTYEVGEVVPVLAGYGEGGYGEGGYGL